MNSAARTAHPFTTGSVTLALVVLALVLPSASESTALYAITVALALLTGAGAGVRRGLVTVIPIWILQYVFEIWVLVVCVAIWFVAVVMGKTPPGLTEAFRFPIAYYVRSTAYTYLLTDKYPPLSETDTGIVLSK